MYENLDHFKDYEDYEDYIAAEKYFISIKYCWDIEDASFLMTSFYVEDVNNGENESMQSKLRELLKRSVIAEKLEPNYTYNGFSYFDPQTIINWAIKNRIWSEGAFPGLLTGTTEDIKSQVHEALKSRKETTYQHIIAALLECIDGIPNANVKKHPSFNNQSALVDFIANHYKDYDGLSKSNLSRKFPEAKKKLEN